MSSIGHLYPVENGALFAPKKLGFIVNFSRVSRVNRDSVRSRDRVKVYGSG